MDKRNKTGLIALGLFTLLCYLTVALFHSSLVYAYSGTANCTAASVSDSRVDPSASVTWTVGPIYNDSSANPVQNGWGMDFDAAAEYITITNAASLNLTNGLTIEFWFKSPTTLNNTGASQHVLKKSPLGGYLDSYSIYISNNGKMYLQAAGLPDTSIETTRATWAADRWHHVVTTFNGSQHVWYVNGTVDRTQNGNAGNITITPSNLYIDNVAGAQSSYTGTIDEVRIYNRNIGSGEAAYSYEHKVPLNQTGLVLWIDFDQQVQDQSGNGNNGAINGDPEYVRGVRGKAALTFDGTGDYVNCGSDASLDDLEQFTWEGWVSIYDLDADLMPFGKRRKYAVIHSTGSFQATIENTGVNAYQKASAGDITENTWFHIAITWDNTSTPRQPNIYINGLTPTLSASVSGTGPMTAEGANNFEIGRHTVGTHYTNGTIDEVRVYNRTLSPTEVSEHYQGIYNNETGLVLYLDFDANVQDHSGEGNNGAVNGDPEYSSGWANCPVSTSYNGTRGTAVSLVNCTTGLCTIPDTAPATPGNYTVTATVPAASENATYLGFIVDRYDVTLAVVDGTVSAGYPAILYATGESYLGDHSLTSGDTVTIDTEAYTWTSILTRFQRSVTQTTIGTRTYGSSITGHEATYNITNFTVNTIHVTWIDGIKYALTNGLIVQAIWLILGASIGTEIAAALIALGVMIPTYIMTDRIEYSAGLWILLGGVLEAQLPGQVLGLGKVLFILGMAVFFWRLFIGGGRQHG